MKRTVAALAAMMLGMLLSPAVSELAAQDSVCVDVQQGPPGLRGLHCGADQAGTVDRLQATISELQATIDSLLALPPPEPDTVFLGDPAVEDSLRVEIAELEAERDSLRAAEAELTAALADAEAARDSLASALASAAAEVDSLSAEIAALETDLAAAVEAWGAEEARSDSLQAVVDSLLAAPAEVDTVFVVDTVPQECPVCPPEDTTVVEPEPEPEPALSDTLIQATAHDSLSWTRPLRGATIQAAQGWTREPDGQLLAETGPRLLRFLALAPPVEPVVDSVTWTLDTLQRRDRAPPWEFSPSALPIFSLPDGEHELTVTYHLHDGTERAISAGFSVAGLGDGAPTKPALDLAPAVDSLRLVSTAAGDTLGMATVTITGTDVAAARGYLWQGGRDDAPDAFDWATVTEGSALTANFREGRWWLCLAPYNTRGTFGQRCNSFEVARP